MDGITLVLDPVAYRRYYQRLAKAFEAARLGKLFEKFCEEHPEICNGVEHPYPSVIDPPIAELAASSAIANLLGAVGFVGPDQEGGPDPNEPWGPVIRDALVGMSIVQLSSAMSDRDVALHVRKVAADLVQRQAVQLQEVVARS